MRRIERTYARLVAVEYKDKGVDEKASDWGYRVCKASRRAHIATWMGRHEKAEAKVLRDRLRRLASILEELPNCGIYEGNVSKRKDSINNYIASDLPIRSPNPTRKESKLVQEIVDEKLGLAKSRSRKCVALNQQQDGKAAAG